MYENENYSGYSTYDMGNSTETNNNETTNSASNFNDTSNIHNTSNSSSAYFDHLSDNSCMNNVNSMNNTNNMNNANSMDNSGSVNNTVESPKKSGGFFKKALLSISLGLFFGIFAGIGFYAVQQGTGLLNPAEDTELLDEKAEEFVETSGSVGQEGMQLSSTNNVTVVQSNVVEVAEEVMPAMVSIVNSYTVTSNFWGQTYSEQEASSGSGIIVSETDSELLIVSNNHVVEGAEKLEVTFIDGTVAEAHIKGLDSDMDLAIIAVSLEDIAEETMDAITVATLGNSDDLKLGEPVIAIGNALGYGQSVTDGIVSALNREITMDDGSTGNFIQTNAAINPGNSGGALLNVNGEVIGINTSKIGGTAIEGMGYAIPITSASPIIADLMERQTRNKVAEEEVGYIGISLQEVTPQIAAMYNWPQGIYVLSIEEGSGAAAAGLMVNDIITKFDGQKISSYDELQNILQYFAAGDTTDITVMRPENGQYVEYEFEITLGERPTDR